MQTKKSVGIYFPKMVADADQKVSADKFKNDCPDSKCCLTKAAFSVAVESVDIDDKKVRRYLHPVLLLDDELDLLHRFVQ